jgi:hypothetical protein
MYVAFPIDTKTYIGNWKPHVQRMLENKIPRQMMDYQLQEIRSRGRDPEIDGKTKLGEPQQALVPNA